MGFRPKLRLSNLSRSVTCNDEHANLIAAMIVMSVSDWKRMYRKPDQIDCGPVCTLFKQATVIKWERWLFLARARTIEFLTLLQLFKIFRFGGPQLR
jgi:hypothetical protein